MDQSLGRRAIGSFAWFFSNLLAQQVTRLASIIILAHLLTPAEFGIAAAAAIILNFSDVFSQMGVGAALVQKSEIDEAHKSTGFLLSLALGTFLGVAVFVAADEIQHLLGIAGVASFLKITAFCFPLRSLSVVSEALLTREMHFRSIAIVAYTSYLIGSVITAIWLALLGYGAMAIAMGQVIQASLASAAYLCIRFHRLRFTISTAAARDLVSFGAPLTLGQLGNFVSQNVDNFIIGRWLGAAPLGFYSRAYLFLMQPANLVGGAADRVLFPALSKVRGDREKLSFAMMSINTWVAMTATPLAAAMIITAPEVVRVVLGPGWEASVLPMQILAASLTFRTGYKIADTLARATGAISMSARRQWLFALLVAAFSAIGVPWGVAGVATGVVLAVTIHYWVMTVLACRLTGAAILPMIALHSRYVVASLPMAAACYGAAIIGRDQAFGPFFTLAFAMGCSAIIYILTLIVGGERLHRDLAVIGRLVGYRFPRLEKFLAGPILRRRGN